MLLIFGLLAVSYWLGWWPGEHHLTAQKLYRQLASPLLRLLIYMGVGLLVGQAIESLGWAAKLGGVAAPLLRWGHLRRECGASFTAAFFSGILANTMLFTLYQEEKISRREMTVTYLLNSGLPVYLLHLPTTFFIILPLTKQAGLIYLGLTLSAAALRTAAYLVYARVRLPAASAGESSAAAPPPVKKKVLLQEIWGKFRQRFSRVILYTLPIYLLIFVLNDGGFFKWLRQAMAAYVSVGFLPMEAASVVIFSVATEFTSGMAAAGAFMQAGTLTVQQTVMALILGNIVATPIRALRHQLPSHMGIFSPKLGTEYLLLSQGLRLVSLVAVAVPYAIWG
ncbi:MAG: nucleoside recognition domain-containing protein [Deltaproteobacteria bacterium]|nr:nucleoside recognition domain-containing protein [Deltaproteobacteria bacterium]